MKNKIEQVRLPEQVNSFGQNDDLEQKLKFGLINTT